MYKTVYLKGNPNFEYQNRNGVWYKRPINSNKSWYKVDSEGVIVLNTSYHGKNKLYFYSNTFIFSGIVVIAGLGYLAYKHWADKSIKN